MAFGASYNPQTNTIKELHQTVKQSDDVLLTFADLKILIEYFTNDWKTWELIVYKRINALNALSCIISVYFEFYVELILSQSDGWARLTNIPSYFSSQ